MRIIDSQTPRKRRPPASRKRDRASRRYASGFAPLEPRQLPSAMIAVAATPASAPSVGPLASQQWTTAADRDAAATQAGLPTQPPQGPAWQGSPGDPAEGTRQGWATPVPIGRPAGGPGDDRDGAPISMAQANLMVAGVPTPEFAFADEETGQVSVVVGDHLAFSYDIGPGPAMVKLADLNGDGRPDLIVADSSADSVLVFLGQSGGAFGTGPGQLRTFDVGADPAGITVGNIYGGGPGGPGSAPDLVVADKGSNAVTILLGKGQGASWTLTTDPTPIQLPDGSAPVRAFVADLNNDGEPDLLVLNSGADDVYIYRGEGGGSFDVADPTILPVGLSPAEMFVGRFDRRPGLDLVTVNSGSNDLTFISAFASPEPITSTYSSGGTQPDAAIAVDPQQGGILDLVVANGGDGRLALLQPADVGLQLAGVITRSDIPSPTAIAPDGLNGDRLEVYAATAGLDAAAILQFDLGPASSYLAIPVEQPGATNAGDDQLVAQLMPLGDSPLDIVAVLWNGADEPEAARSASANTAYYAKGEGQGGDGPVVATAATGESGDPEPTPRPAPPGDPTSYLRFVLDAERALVRSRFEVDAVAPGDSAEGRDAEGPAAFARQSEGLDSLAVDDALSSLWSDGAGRSASAPDRAGKASDAPPDPAGEMPMGLENWGEDARSEAAPVISSTLLAARLILKASPPKPPSFRRRTARALAIGPVGGPSPRV